MVWQVSCHPLRLNIIIVSGLLQEEHDEQEEHFESELGDDPWLPRAAAAASSSSSRSKRKRMTLNDETFDAVASRAGLESTIEGSGIIYTTKSGVRLGKVWAIGDTSFKAECSLHPKCKIFIDAFRKSDGHRLRDPLDVLKKQVEWLSVGPGFDVEGHRKEAVDVKTSLGMKLRNRAV